MTKQLSEIAKTIGNFTKDFYLGRKINMRGIASVSNLSVPQRRYDCIMHEFTTEVGGYHRNNLIKQFWWEYNRSEYRIQFKAGSLSDVFTLLINNRDYFGLVGTACLGLARYTPYVGAV